jgi:hypothetical protein
MQKTRVLVYILGDDDDNRLITSVVVGQVSGKKTPLIQ